MPIFELPFTFSPADMPAAFYVAVGSRTDESHPREVQLDAHHHLTDEHGHELHRLSYAIIEVKAIRRRDATTLKREPWMELLEEIKNSFITASLFTEGDVRRALHEWKISSMAVRNLARREQSVLHNEIDDIIRLMQAEIEENLPPLQTMEATGLDTYDDDWQELLQVSDQQELHEKVARYQEMLQETAQIAHT